MTFDLVSSCNHLKSPFSILAGKHQGFFNDMKELNSFIRFIYLFFNSTVYFHSIQHQELREFIDLTIDRCPEAQFSCLS